MVPQRAKHMQIEARKGINKPNTPAPEPAPCSHMSREKAIFAKRFADAQKTQILIP
jgi:hypothetical protein